MSDILGLSGALGSDGTLLRRDVDEFGLDLAERIFRLLAEVAQRQPDLLASHFPALPNQRDQLPDKLLGQRHRGFAPGDGELAVPDNEPDVQPVLDESGVLIPPAKQALHLRPGDQGNTLDLDLIGFCHERAEFPSPTSGLSQR